MTFSAKQVGFPVGQLPTVSSNFILPGGATVISGLINTLGTGDTDIYLVPTGFRAIIEGYHYNASGNTFNVIQTLKIGGVYVKLNQGNILAAGSSFNYTMNGASWVPANAGETIAINTGNSGSIFWYTIRQWPDNRGNLKGVTVGSLASGDNTLYTVPANMKAILWGQMQINNNSGSARVYQFKLQKSGGSVVQAAPTSASVGNNGLKQFVYGNIALDTGDAVIVNSNAATATQSANITLFEIPN